MLLNNYYFFDCHTEVNINLVNTSKRFDSGGYLLQRLPFVDNLVIRIFSINVTLFVEKGSVCALVFLNKDKIPVIATAPLRYIYTCNRINTINICFIAVHYHVILTCRETGSVITIASLTYSEDDSMIMLSEYDSMLVTAVETIEAALVTNGTCFLQDIVIASNVSTKRIQSEGEKCSKHIANMLIYLYSILLIIEPLCIIYVYMVLF